jgi:hypothetical protein
MGFAQTPARAQVAESIQLSAGSTIPAMFEKGVDARKNKVGDEVIVRTTENVKSGGQVVIPRGAKIVGHVTVVQSKTSAESESAVGIGFDHAVLTDGRSIPLPLDIQAIAPESGRPIGPSDVPSVAPLSAGGASLTPSAGNIDAASGPGLSPTGELTPGSQGVLGIDGLALRPETAEPAEGSVIISQRRNVHLDGRTQIMLRVKGK